MKAYREVDGGGDLFSALDHQKKVTGYDTKDWSKGGRRPFDPVFMFKLLVLQKFHGLSDEATEQ